ncbi:PEP-CTERM sorting domain-containing protein [Chitinibacteraceae bacterium HSL-7]
MTKFKLGAMAFALMLVGNAHAALQNISFDNVPGAVAGSSNNALGSYAGFDWDNTYVLSRDTHVGSGYDRGAVSGNWVGYTAWTNPSAFSSDHAFNFYAGYFTAAWQTSLDVVVKGFRNGVELYSQTINVTDARAQAYAFNFFGVDRVSFTPNGSHVAFDNLQVAPVPEPETYALMGLGLLGLAAARRRKQR